MLEMVEMFTGRASELPGVRRIALVGSITTPKPQPKDLDLLVTVDSDSDLKALAHLGRQVRGRLQSINHSCDVFLADPAGT
jgi:predicted nucleotidyltransferase